MAGKTFLEQREGRPVKQDALEESYRAYRQDLYLYALSLCRDPVLADELTAETFYRALLSLEADASSVRCWLLRVCKNLFYDLLRRRKRAGDRTVPEEYPDPAPGVLEQLIRDERRRLLYREILLLSPGDRELLLLFYFERCPVAEISRLTGKSPGAVKTGLTRARSRLKKRLEEEWA